MINLTQHKSTPEQNCTDLTGVELSYLQSALTFDTPPTLASMLERAELITQIAKNKSAESAMIGGAPYFMPILSRTLLSAGIQPYYSFTQRVIISEANGEKTSRFSHITFIEAV